MNRRGILGALVGAPIAAPAIAKEAFSQKAIADAMTFAPGVFLSPSLGAISAASEGRWIEPEDALRKAFKLGIVSREKLAELLASMRISDSPIMAYQLDADLASAKSFSMAARVRMQRERNVDREINRFLAKPKSFWDYGRELVEKGIVSHDD